jgi:Cft2 family RNA processing exonuclease
MFYFDNGLRITAPDLAVDFRRRQPRGFISHAHTDHMARHELAYCTPSTAELYQHRYGPRATRPMPFGEPLAFSSVSLTTHPAGHVFGSAMLMIAGDEGTVLYTGDFKLRPSATAELAAPPKADVLIMESTYGEPRYRLPPREEAIAQLIATVSRVLNTGRTPVVHAYVLGKAQERRSTSARLCHQHDLSEMRLRAWSARTVRWSPAVRCSGCGAPAAAKGGDTHGTSPASVDWRHGMGN